MRRFWLTWTGVVLAASMAGCFDLGAADSSKEEAVAPTCSSDGDCGSGLVCDSVSRWCVVDQKVVLTASLRLVPQATSSVALEEQYASIQLKNTSVSNFQLHRPLRVVGRVFLAENPLSAVTDAEVAMVGESEIPGLEAQVQAVAGLPSLPGEDGYAGPSEEGSFEFSVLKNKSYDIYIHLPDLAADELPPYHVRRSFTSVPNATDPYTVAMDLQVPGPADYPHISGTVVWRSSLDSQESTPLSGAKVVAYSLLHGNTSSTVITDADGSFDLRIQPPEELEGEQYALYVRPSSANELVPTLKLANFTALDSEELGTLELVGSLTPSNLVVSVSGMAESDALSLVGATLRAEALWGEEGSLVVERVLQGTTWTSLALPPGLYTLSLRPPAESPWATIWQSLTVAASEPSPDSLPLQVELKVKERPTLSGSVLSPDGQAVADATVRATCYQTPYGAALSRQDAALSVFSGKTDQDGQYALGLDPGTYLVEVEPPVSLGLPKAFFWEVVVLDSSHAEFALPKPVAFSGEIMAGDQSVLDAAGGSAVELPQVPAEGVHVELYDPAWPADLAPLPLAEATTDAKGHFSVLLPAESED